MVLANAGTGLESLVVRAQMGDEQAYEDLVHRFQDMALSYAYSILGDMQLAEDARQEAFIDAYCDLLSLRDPAAFPGWFRTIVHSNSINLVRGRRILTVPLDETFQIASTEPNAQQIAEQGETRDIVLKAIDALPEAESEITRLYFIEHLTQRAISDRLGVPTGTVKHRLHRARARLRQRLMDMVKKKVKHNTLTGDNQIVHLACSEAIDHFKTEINLILDQPTAEMQQHSLDLLCAQGRMHRFVGQTQEAIETFRKALKLSFVKMNISAKARFRSEIARTYLQMCDYDQARKEYQASHVLLRKGGGCVELETAICNGLGMCAWGKGEYSKAHKKYKQALSAGDTEECKLLQGETRNNLGLLDWKAGRLQDALVNFRGCHKQWKKTGNRLGAAVALMNMAIIEEISGRLTPARRHYEESLKLAEDMEYLQVQVAIHVNLGNMALLQSRWALALQENGTALELAQRIGDRRNQAIALENLALSHLGTKEYGKAQTEIEQAHALSAEIGDKERSFSLQLVEIEYRLDRGEFKDLPHDFESLKAELDKSGYLSELPRLLRLKAWKESQAGEFREMGKTLRKGLKESRKQQNRSEEKRILKLEKMKKR